MKNLNLLIILFLSICACSDSKNKVINEFEERKNVVIQLSEYAGNDVNKINLEFHDYILKEDTLIIETHVDAIPTDRVKFPYSIDPKILENITEKIKFVKFDFKIRCLQNETTPFSYLYGLSEDFKNLKFSSFTSDPDKREQLTIKPLRESQYHFNGSMVKFSAQNDQTIENKCFEFHFDATKDQYSILIEGGHNIHLSKDEFINIMTSETTYGDTSKIAYAFNNILNLRTSQVYKGIKYSYRNVKYYTLNPKEFDIHETNSTDGFLGFIGVSDSDGHAYCSTSMEGINIKYFFDHESGYLDVVQMAFSDETGSVFERIVLVRING